MEQRYANQLIYPFTVLQHQWMMISFCAARQLPSHVIAYAAVHDTAEAFVRDVPSPLKTPQAKAMEAAIYYAMPWADFQVTDTTYSFKEIDGWCSAIEAKVLGQWNTDLVSKRLPTDQGTINQMLALLEVARDTPIGLMLEMWKAFVLENCVARELLNTYGIDKPFILHK